MSSSSDYDAIYNCRPPPCEYVNEIYRLMEQVESLQARVDALEKNRNESSQNECGPNENPRRGFKSAADPAANAVLARRLRRCASAEKPDVTEDTDINSRNGLESGDITVAFNNLRDELLYFVHGQRSSAEQIASARTAGQRQSPPKTASAPIAASDSLQLRRLRLRPATVCACRLRRLRKNLM